MLMGPEGLDFTAVWTGFLIFVRTQGMLSTVPGIGGQAVGPLFRTMLSISVAFAISLAGVRSPPPEELAVGGLMIITEYLLGFVIGFIPTMIISGVAVAGQVTSGAIGLGQANMIDPSLGVSVAVLARIQSSVATIVFLMIDGHHVLFRALATTMHSVGKPYFLPNELTTTLLVSEFREAFALSVVVAAPILVTLLVTQFVLGLITKFVPQVNIFIISLPLTIMVGLYIVAFTWEGFAIHVYHELATVEEVLASLMLVL